MSTTQTSYRVCMLCEAMCGIAVEHDDKHIHGVRGDDDDPFSKGHICPKAVALIDLHHDPDRLRRPVKREGESWKEVSWEEALDDIGARTAALQAEHGRDAIAYYYGNPTGHSYSAVLFANLFAQALGTKNVYSANSVDALPRFVTSVLLYGNQAVMPVPDIDRTDYLLILGANPAVSNGSVMTAPDAAGRLKAIRERGGKVIVIDPRRTETAEIADEHHFIRPGGDAILLASMLRTIFVEGLDRPGELADITAGLGELRSLVAPFTPERASRSTGISADTIRTLARSFAKAKKAVCYGRMGTCTQRSGTTTTWLIDALNIVTGNMDRPGGSMFTTPAVDLVPLTKLIGLAGAFDRFRSRVDGLPEFNGEVPVAALANEAETEGPGQIKALFTHAGNPVLSLPNGRRLDAAFSKLDLMVSIDIYRNETTRHAHYILPPTFGLERDHYDLLFHGVSVRNTARYSLPLFPKPEGSRHDWEIFLDLVEAVGKRRGFFAGVGAGLMSRAIRKLEPRGMLNLLLKTGPRKISLKDLEAAPRGLDFGPLEPRLRRILATQSGKVELAPDRMKTDITRLAKELAPDEGTSGEKSADRRADADANKERDLLLIGRRTLRSNNSWMHNSLRLVKGRDRCTLLMHPDDAASRGLTSGMKVAIRSRIGEIAAPLEVSDEMMKGVVSLPHGWGHDRPGTQLSVASAHAGVSVNDIVDDASVETVTGTSILTGVPVSVSAAPGNEAAAAE